MYKNSFCIRLYQTRLCVGHYAVSGFAAPIKPTLKIGADHYLFIDVTDNSKTRVLKSKASITAINTAFPAPVRFRQVWQFQRGNKSLYAWRAQPPEGFVALGMICTTAGTTRILL